MNSGRAADRHRRFARLPAYAGVISCCLLSGCGIQTGTPSPAGTAEGRNSTSTLTSTPHSDSDPGDRRLHLLASDPVMADLPAGLVKTGEKDTPAHYVTPVFGSGGSFGASVSVTFISAAGIRDIYKIVGDNAARNGWVGLAVGSTGMTDRWVKTYPDGSPATLFLSCKDPSVTTSKRSCALDGGI